MIENRLKAVKKRELDLEEAGYDEERRCFVVCLSRFFGFYIKSLYPILTHTGECTDK